MVDNKVAKPGMERDTGWFQRIQKGENQGEN